MPGRWTVYVDRRVVRQLQKLPKEIVEILDQLRRDLADEGPVPRGWIAKHLRGRKGAYSARLKREYRALYEVTGRSIILVHVAHRKEAY